MSSRSCADNSLDNVITEDFTLEPTTRNVSSSNQDVDNLPVESKDVNDIPVNPGYVCPDLSGMKLQGYNPLFQSWTAEIVEEEGVVYDYFS